MSPVFAFAALWLILLATAAFAVARGGMAERLASLCIVFSAVAAIGVHLLASPSSIPMILLMMDGLLALVFLLLAMRYGRTWLGAAMVAQAIQFSLHAYYFIGEREHDLTYSLVNNLVTFSVLGALLAGTVATMRRRAA
ncbi:MAG: hypothetical protein ABW063_15615 [Caulobacter sp.]